MSEQVTYLETGSLDPHYNLAFEEYVLCNRREGEYLLLWQNDNTIVIGQNQNAEAEHSAASVEPAPQKTRGGSPRPALSST